MDGIDKKLLNIIQKGLPIESRPFLELSKQIGITEEETIERLRKLKDKKVIRRFGGIFDSRRLGYCSTLCAISVPKERIEEVASVINKHNEITHNYIREHKYNMWFTIIAPSKERIKEIIFNIKEETKIDDIINLPSEKLFKIKAAFIINEDVQ